MEKLLSSKAEENLLNHLYDAAIGKIVWEDFLRLLRIQSTADYVTLAMNDLARERQWLLRWDRDLATSVPPEGIYYYELLSKLKYKHQVSIVIEATEEYRILLSLYRISAPFSAEIRRRMDALQPHIQRAFEIRRRLAHAASAGEKPTTRAEHTNLGKLLSRHYKLTPMQIRLSQNLLEGGSLREVAQKINISYESARTHLKNIFTKTGVRRQAELAKLLEHIAILGVIPGRNS